MTGIQARVLTQSAIGDKDEGQDNMRVARLRLMLWSIGAVASAGAIIAVVAAVACPLATPPSMAVASSSRRAPAATQRAAPGHVLPPLAFFEPAWQRTLRRPLVDPPPAPPPVQTVAQQVKPEQLHIRLIGTIVDGRHPRGVFLTGLSVVELKGVGEKAGGAEVLAIDENTATLAYGGASFLLRREKNPFDPSGENYNAAAQSPPHPVDAAAGRQRGS